MVVLDFSVRLGLKRWNLGSLGFNFISEALGSFWLVLCGSFKIECNTVDTFVWKRLNESVVQSILATKLKALFDVYFCQSLRQDAPQTLCGTLRWRCPFLQCWRGYSDPRKAPKPLKLEDVKASNIPLGWKRWKFPCLLSHDITDTTWQVAPAVKVLGIPEAPAPDLVPWDEVNMVLHHIMACWSRVSIKCEGSWISQNPPLTHLLCGVMEESMCSLTLSLYTIFLWYDRYVCWAFVLCAHCWYDQLLQLQPFGLVGNFFSRKSLPSVPREFFYANMTSCPSLKGHHLECPSAFGVDLSCTWFDLMGPSWILSIRPVTKGRCPRKLQGGSWLSWMRGLQNIVCNNIYHLDRLESNTHKLHQNLDARGVEFSIYCCSLSFIHSTSRFCFDCRKDKRKGAQEHGLWLHTWLLSHVDCGK